MSGGERGSMNDEERSYEKIERDDLLRLAALARADREGLFARRPRLGELYKSQLFCVALCQGAALHFVDRRNGIKDFDIWTFFAEHPNGRIPVRRRAKADFGLSKFGRNPGDQGVTGRRVDFMMRAIRVGDGEDLVAAIRSYLGERRTKSSRSLAEKAVVIIEPEELCGVVVWP